MNKEHGQPQEQTSDNDASKSELPVSRTQAVGAGENRAESQKQSQSSADLHHISRWRGPWNWFSKITVAEVGMLCLTLAIAASSIVYTKYAKRQWSVMRDQLSEMKAAQRPWLGSESFELTHPITFIQINQPGLSEVTVTIDYSVTLKNYGTSLARREYDTFFVQLSRDPNTWQRWCEMANQTSSGKLKDATNGIFPNGERSRNGGTSFAIPADVHELGIIWVVGCIAYQDTSGQMHHTATLYRSESPPNVAPSVTSTHPLIKYAPITGFKIEDSDAD
ncbi:MAG: hypothetical protein ACLQVL_17125 [Terriglobia bacterium]